MYNTNINNSTESAEKILPKPVYRKRAREYKTTRLTKARKLTKCGTDNNSRILAGPGGVPIKLVKNELREKSPALITKITIAL